MSDAHIRTLKLKASNEIHVRRCLALLEDGFRSAYFPGFPPGCLILVRHLDLGKISTSDSSATVSLRIGERMRTLSALAVSGNEGEVSRADIVWFRDRLEPYVVLARMIARGQTPTAWYWRCAAPGWIRGDDSRTSLLTLLQCAAQGPVGASGSARIVEMLHEIGRLDPVLEIAEPPHALSILRHSALFPRLVEARASMESPSLTVIRAQTLSWAQTLAKWAQEWGEDDVRTKWLVYTSLVIQNPALTESAQTVELIGKICWALVRKSEDKMLSATSLTSTRPNPRLAQEPSHEQADRINRRSRVIPKEDELTAPGIRFDMETENNGGSQSTYEQAPPEWKEISSNSPMRNRPEPPLSQKLCQEQTVEITGRDNQTQIEDELSAPGSRFILEMGDGDDSQGVYEQASPACNDGSGPLDLPVASGALSQDVEGVAREALSHRTNRSEDGFGHTIAELRQTDSAGLLFIVRVLELLGIREILDSHPSLAERNLPARLLWSIVQRLDIEAEDPVCAYLPADPGVSQRINGNFVAPLRWRQLLSRSSTAKQMVGIRPVIAKRDLRVLTDGSGRQILAFWAGEMPLSVQPWLGDALIKDLPPLRKAPEIGLVECAFMTIIGRLLRLHTGMSLRSLVRRPGRVAATPVWVDVVFNATQADTSIRKAGIDFDPGWVPWLGKVIQFHYLESEVAEHDEQPR